MKTLILGSGGFIGSHMARLLARSCSVHTASTSGTRGPQHCVIDKQAPDFTALVAAVQPDVVVNCMGAANVPGSFIQPDADYQLNVALLRQVLCALRDIGFTGRFLQLSSAAVYGNPPVVPIPESAPLAPISPYGWHKFQAELICREFSQISKIRTTALRLFSVFGPGLRRQLLWDVYMKSRQGNRIELFGTGEETRDFIYVKDVALVVERLMSVAPEQAYESVNVALGRKISTKYAANYLLKCLGWSGELHFSSQGRVGDPAIWQADVHQLSRIGFQPSYEFETGIEELCWWLKDLG